MKLEHAGRSIFIFQKASIYVTAVGVAAKDKPTHTGFAFWERRHRPSVIMVPGRCIGLYKHANAVCTAVLNEKSPFQRKPWRSLSGWPI
jgi:hypothetical protein